MNRYLLLTTILVAASSMAEQPVSSTTFSREVLPILSDRCFHCHGPDPSHRKAKLRLDLEAEAKAERDGSWILKAGDPENSAIWQRIITDDPDELMPPPDSHREPLSQKERAVIRRWIAAGAPWGKHWAFEKPVRPTVPGTAKHPVDAFVRAQLKRNNLTPAEPAEPHTQLRRLSFGLTGLPPTPEDVADYAKSPTDAAWQKQVDRLLASPHYGERMAMWWLDASRYSDTDGFQQDHTRTNWPWRDWVVNAFNNNKPFDQFTTEQFAGDLLPNATAEQKLATCFHRNHMTNGEGGRHKEESRIDYVIDRVNTTGTVFLGLTLGCVQCHTHKFDPITHEDYYSLFAFFNSIDEDGRAGTGAKPYLKYTPKVPEAEIKQLNDYWQQWRTRVGTTKKEAESDFNKSLATLVANTPANHKTWNVLDNLKASSEDGTAFILEKDGIIQTTGPQPLRDHYLVEVAAADLPIRRIAGWKLEVHPHPSHHEGKLARGGDGNFTLEGAKIFIRNSDTGEERALPMNKAIANYEDKPKKSRTPGKVSGVLNDDPRNGWRASKEHLDKMHVAAFTAAQPDEIRDNEVLCIQLEHRPPREYATIGRFRLFVTSDQGEHLGKLTNRSPLEDLAKLKQSGKTDIDDNLRGRLLSQYLLAHDAYQKMVQDERRLSGQLRTLRDGKKPKNVQVLAERKNPRKSHILVRGVWDAKGKEVSPAVLPAVLDWPADKTKTRLDLAKWITAPDNPLTARVIVNQIWLNLFGSGLVRTPEDFGLQGEHPTHPDLLDWLAVEFVENDWDVHHLIRTIVSSETYRQSSSTYPELLEKDPDNRRLARAPRFRLPAWMIRDNALASAGLLNRNVGGPPVYPWQPEGVWNEIFMGRFRYRASLGPSQYRRTIYAFWRRSSAPTFLFDSAQRRVCEISVKRTNTPLQALTLLNDVTMQEAARALADTVPSDTTAKDALQAFADRIIGRPLSPTERKIYEKVAADARNFYDKNPDEAVKLTAAGQQFAHNKTEAPQIAAWMVTASTMFNLDEAMTHE